jgi:phage terminase large subunit
MTDDQRVFNIVDTSATRKIFALTKRIRAVAGGTAASKTVSIVIWLIDYCQRKQEREKLCTVTSESYPHLQKGAMLDFETIMKDHNYWRDGNWNATKHEYTFETGNKLEFATFDTYSKAHGARRDVLFGNEVNNMPYNIVDQLIVRTREIVWLDWNPTSEFWFYQTMLPTRDDIDFITLTYKDNEALDTQTIKEIESHKNNLQWWTVYGLGQLGVLENRIYKNWEIIDMLPDSALLRRYGLDFGYTNDPTASDAIYVWNGAYVIDEVIDQKGLSNRQIADIFLNRPERALIVADSAEPKSIDEIRNYGLNIIPSHKGVGSVLQGIQYVQGQKIYITKRSVNTIKEYRNYLWLEDKEGNIINEPSPIWNHHMDDIRYGMESLKAVAPKAQTTDYGGVKPLYPEIGVI